MARIRTVKPELLRHEGLFDLEESTGLPIMLSFIGMLTVSDREGRFKWRPKTLKLDALPYHNVDFSRVLDALETGGFIVRYEVDGEMYGCIPTFTKHQVINNKERDSELPPLNAITTRQARVTITTMTLIGRGKGRGIGRKKKTQLKLCWSKTKFPTRKRRLFVLMKNSKPRRLRVM